MPKSPYRARVSEMVCMLILYLSAQTSCTWLFLPAPSTSFLFAFRSQITSSHFHLFPFLFLLLYILKQRRHFNVNSVFAHMPLNPPPSFCTAFAQIPEKLKQKTCICLWGLPHNMFAASWKAIHFFLWGAQMSCSVLCARAPFPYGIPFMMHDKSCNPPSPLQHSANNPSCSEVMTVTTGIITHFSSYAAPSVFLSMPTWNLSWSRCARVYLLGANWALLEVLVVLE